MSPVIARSRFVCAMPSAKLRATSSTVAAPDSPTGSSFAFASSAPDLALKPAFEISRVPSRRSASNSISFMYSVSRCSSPILTSIDALIFLIASNGMGMSGTSRPSSNVGFGSYSNSTSSSSGAKTSESENTSTSKTGTSPFRSCMKPLISLSPNFATS